MRFAGAVWVAAVTMAATATATTVVVRPPVVSVPNKAPGALALDAALSLRDTLGLGASTLVVSSTHPTADGGHVVRLAQRVGRLPVQDGVVTVRLSAGGEVLRVQSGVVAVDEIDPTPTLTGAQALDVARAAVTAPLPSTPSGYGQLIVTRTGRLAWQVRVTVAVPTSAPQVIVDAHTGDVLEVTDLARHVGKANVFASGRAAKAARKTDGSFSAGAAVEVDLAHVESTETGANLKNSRLIGLNCCPTQGCDQVSEPKRLVSTVNVGLPVPVKLSLPMCDEMPLAAADANGDFLSQPAQEPTGPNSPVPGASEDNDVFAEINAFHHVSTALAYVESLNGAFELPPDARPLRISTNFILPDFNEVASKDLGQLYQDVMAGKEVVVEGFTRFANAMYMPKGAGEQLGAAIPGFKRDFDSVIFFQGPNADFGYDPAVVVHEFGHGVVAATAQLADYSQDDQGIIDAPGALNEGFADFWAAAHLDQPQIGQYVGDLVGQGEGALRDLENDFSCPSVLWNEVHQDSQHFSAALWAARVAIAGDDADKRVAFDRAVLTAMYALTPTSSFDAGADALGLEIEAAFDASARATFDAKMAERKVTGCERVVDLSEEDSLGPVFLAPRTAARGWSPIAPGPVQFRIVAPKGANRIGVAIEVASGGGGGLPIPGMGGGGEVPAPKALLKADSRVVFGYGAQVTHDATSEMEFDGSDLALFEIEGGCGDKAFYLALGNVADAQVQVADLSVSFNIDQEAAAACDAAGVPDAGTDVPDAGTDGSGGDTPDGCGCSAGGSLLAPLAGLVLALRRRRR